jgi:hypothetical protein
VEEVLLRTKMNRPSGEISAAVGLLSGPFRFPSDVSIAVGSGLSKAELGTL